MEYFKLSNQKRIPKIGMGTNTFGKVGNEYNEKLSGDLAPYITAINNGYRLFDTAIVYRNEQPLGEAIRNSKINREEFYVVSKIPADPDYIETPELVQKAVERSLSEIDLEYIDLYLIHKPIANREKLLMVWKVLESYYKEGLLKAIGVSNFSAEDIKYLIENSNTKPMVNQIKVNSSNWNLELINELKQLNVLPQAYSPLKGLSNQAIELLSEIGKKYNKTFAQVIIKYHIQNNVDVVVKSHNRERQYSNIDVFDFKLDENDIKKIKDFMKEETINDL